STYGYDAYGNRVSYTDPEGRTTASTYNSYGQMLTQTDARGNGTSYTYDELGRRATMRDAGNGLWTYAYDGNGNKTAEVDPLNRTTGYEYDAKNRLTKTTYPDSTFTQTAYDFRDKPLTVTDQLGRVTKNEYDLAGQLKKVTYAFGTADAGSVEYTYDLAGRRLTEKDERGNVTTSAYDDAGRLVSVTNAQGKVKSFAYDDADRRTSSTDEKNRVTVFEFDGRRRNTKVTYPDAKFVTQVFDGLNRLTSRTDQDNRVTVWGYDKVSQLTQVTDALNQLTSYGYDLAGNKIRQTDANGHVTSYEYDALNRRTRRTLPAGQYEAFTYDAVGNMVTRRNFNAKTTTHAYDSMSRLLSMTPDASLSGQTPIMFTYSGSGKRLTMADASGTTTWTYDFRDRVKTKATLQGTLTYGYHPNSLVASVVSSNANGVNVSYAYDSLNRLQTVTDQVGATSFTWDDAGNPATMAYPNGVVHTFGTDVMDRMNAVTKTPNTLASYSYTFGNSGQKLTATESGGRSMSWGYDAVYKLLSETVVPDGTVNYTLDAVGNRLSRGSTITGIPSTTNTFDLNDRISGDTFDDNGNTLTSGGQTFGYDFLDRLTSYNGGAVTMVYDGDGNRIGKTAGGATTRYLVDDLTPTGYAQVAEEVVAGSVVRRYTHGRGRISQTQLIGGSWSSHYYGYDSAFNVRSLTDSAGVLTDTYAYDAFGGLTNSAGATPNVFRYRGEQFDSALGMYYLRARWYLNSTGRFLTADRHPGIESEVLTLNRYAYALPNPIAAADPSGHLRLITLGMLARTAIVVGFAMYGGLRTIEVPDGDNTRLFLEQQHTQAGAYFICIMKKATDAALKNNGIVDPYFDYHSRFADGCRIEPEKTTCSESKPNLIPCSRLWYTCSSKSQALNKVADKWDVAVSDLTAPSSTATSGPCRRGGVYTPGWHVNVDHNERGFLDTLVGCPCCEDTPSGPKELQRWDISQ
ncbi:MAG: RHS repeat-associated core domain-containing protein, partial [Bryobacteraceae bacterium]